MSRRSSEAGHHGDRRVPGGSGAAGEESGESQGDQEAGTRTDASSLVPNGGVDVTQIDAIGVETVEVVLSEYGPDLSRFPTEKQFVSHATLAPRVPKSGGKPLKRKKRNSASTRVAAALRMAALALRRSPTALGAYYQGWRGGSRETWQCLLLPGNWLP